MKSLLIFLLFLSMPALAFAFESNEMITNGDFEQWEGGLPAGWTMDFGATEGEGPESWIAQAEGRDGTGHALELSGDTETRMWYAASQGIAAVPGDRVTVSGWLRTEDVRRDGHRYPNCHLTLVAMDASDQRTGIWAIGRAQGTNGWTHHEQTIQVPVGTTELAVYAFLSMSGTAWYDDISVEVSKTLEADLTLSRDDRWRADLAYLVDSLAKLHINPFTVTTEDVFRARAASVEAEIPDQPDLELKLRFAALVASLGDAHTRVQLHDRPGRMPIRFGMFDDDLRVIEVDRSCAQLAGGRVIRLGGTELSDVLEYLRLLVAHENEWWFRYRAPEELRYGDVVFGLGLSKTMGELEVTVLDEADKEVSATVVLQPKGRKMEYETHQPAIEDTPLYLSDKSAYWSRYLDDSRVFYLQYNTCANDPDYPVTDFTGDVLEALDSLEVDRFVLDLRHNSGGNSSLLDRLIAGVAERRTAKMIGPCFVITGRATFSSGALNALDFRRETDALLVGEPMGNKPNHFGYPSHFELPNSGLDVYYSTKHFVRIKGDPSYLEPDIPTALTWTDYMAGRDPALKAILEHTSP